MCRHARPLLCCAAPLLVLAVLTFPSGARCTGGHDERRYAVREQETIRKTFDLGAGPGRRLEVDNVWGAIEVIGTNSSQAELMIQKTIRATTPEKLKQARREVTLDVTHNAGSLQLYVNGPFRCRCEQDWALHGDPGYAVHMEFQLRVPRHIQFHLRTVNSGDIRVNDLRGNYSVKNVNGGVEMSGVVGSGVAHTVNGPVKVVFRENPREASSFKSINGDIDLYFAPGLSADFRFKTFNGNVYSDFVVTSLPMRGIQEESEGRRKTFRADRYTGGRIGAGGIEISTENLNGDIRIRENR